MGQESEKNADFAVARRTGNNSIVRIDRILDLSGMNNVDAIAKRLICCLCHIESIVGQITRETNSIWTELRELVSECHMTLPKIWKFSF